MDNKFIPNNKLFDEEYEDLDEELDEQDSYLKDTDFYLTETYFYPSSDDRTWKSNVEDIDGGDNFADYCSYVFKMLDEEEYFDK